MNVIMLTLGMLMFTTSASITTCPIAQSVYRDAEGQGFELVFSESTNTVSKATATITHPDEAQLYRFDVTQSSGYGSIFLTSINALGEPLGNSDSLELYFFDENFWDATPIFLGDETESPKYAFISGLGSHDYYNRRGEDVTPPLLEDAMWIHDRCQ